MKRYLCILFLLFDCFIFRGDYASASGVDRLVEAVYTGAGDFSAAYANDANGNMTRDLNKGISNISYNLLTCREKQDREDGEVNGSTVANVIALNANANKWTAAHEIGHSLLLRHTSYGTIMNPGASYTDRDLDNNPMVLIRNNVVDNPIRNQFIEMFKKLKNRKRK